MHMTIGVIVSADDEDDAKEKAKEYIETITGDSGPFDWFTLYDDMDKDKDEEDLGRGIYRVQSRKGKKWVSQLMKWTKAEFMDSLARIRKVMSNHDDEAIWQNSTSLVRPESKDFDMDMFRYRCHTLGAYTGPSVWLYCEGEGLRDEASLHSVLTEAKNDPTESLWIVLSDVHY